MKAESPTLYIIAGANGVGKTTSFYDLFPIESTEQTIADIKNRYKKDNEI